MPALQMIRRAFVVCALGLIGTSATALSCDPVMRIPVTLPLAGTDADNHAAFAQKVRWLRAEVLRGELVYGTFYKIKSGKFLHEVKKRKSGSTKQNEPLIHEYIYRGEVGFSGMRLQDGQLQPFETEQTVSQVFIHRTWGGGIQLGKNLVGSMSQTGQYYRIDGALCPNRFAMDRTDFEALVACLMDPICAPQD